MNPALVKARQRMQASIERDYGGSITIDGRSYDCAVTLDPVNRVQNDSGNWESHQTIHVSVRKKLMPCQPERRAVLIHNGVKFNINGEIGGQNDVDEAWLIDGHRKLPSPT